MPKVADRVYETTTTTGTGTITLAGAKTKYRSFSTAVTDGDLADGDTVYYVIQDGDDWEISSGVFTVSGTTLTRVLIRSSTGALLNLASGSKDVFCTAPASALGIVGKIYLGYWPAAALKPSTTNGMDALTWDESATNDVMDGYLGASASTDQYAQFEFITPQSLDESAGFIYQFHWKEAASATAHNVVWQGMCQAQSDGDTIDSAWGTAVTVQDTGTNATTRRVSAQTSAAAPAGSWVAGDVMKHRVGRLASDTANDTLDVKAHLLGVAVYAVNTSWIEP